MIRNKEAILKEHEERNQLWREEARTQARADLKAEGLQGEEALEFYAGRYAEYYAALKVQHFADTI